MNPTFEVYTKDVIQWLNEYDGPKFSFALSDPPYEINHLGGWDKSGITYSPDLYKGMLNVLHPGAFVALYGYSRTHHRMMAAMEDAGFILHKVMFAWVYTTGNPLGAQNLQHKIDDLYVKKYGGYCQCNNPIVERTDWAYVDVQFKEDSYKVNFCKHCGRPMRVVINSVKWGESGGMKLLGGRGYGNNNKQIIAESMTPEAEMFKNYTYGAAWSKPMLEPIILAQAPFDTKSQVEGIIKYGTGVVNVHEARHTDRWPGNFIAVHGPECTLDRLTGVWDCNCPISDYVKDDPEFYDKIPTFGYSIQDIALSSVDHMLYDSKPNKKERHGGVKHNPHPSIKPISVNRYLGGLFLPPEEFAPRQVLNLFSGSGSEAIGLLHAGWDNVTSVEINKEYAQVSLDRVSNFVYGNVSYILKDE